MCAQVATPAHTDCSENGNGIAIKGGDVRVIDSTIRGLHTDAEATQPSLDIMSGSGFIDTGDGLYVETSYSYPVNVTISGNSTITCVAQSAQAVRIFPVAPEAKVTITGGIYSTDVSAYLQQGYICTEIEDQYIVTAQ